MWPNILNMCFPGYICQRGFLKVFTSRFTGLVMSTIKVYAPKSSMEHVQERCSCVGVGRYFNVRYFVFLRKQHCGFPCCKCSTSQWFVEKKVEETENSKKWLSCSHDISRINNVRKESKDDFSVAEMPILAKTAVWKALSVQMFYIIWVKVFHIATGLTF